MSTRKWEEGGETKNKCFFCSSLAVCFDLFFLRVEITYTPFCRSFVFLLAFLAFFFHF